MKNLIVNHSFTSESAPIYEERISRGGWVNRGTDNLFPEYLISLMNRSGEHAAILSTKASMVGGNGWDLEGLDQIAIQFLSNVYNKDNMNEIVYKCAYDFEMFGDFSLQIIYSKDKSKIAEVNFIPSNKVRLSECGKYVWYCDDWSNIRKYQPVKYPIYNSLNPTGTQIMYYKEYRPGINYYAMPKYISAINWIELEYEISLYHLSQVKNGFHPSMVMNFVEGKPTEDEMDSVVADLRKSFEGARNAGNVMFLFSDGPEKSVQITPFEESGSDNKFDSLDDRIMKRVLIAHEVNNPTLFGVTIQNELGQKNTILESLEFFTSKYVKPRQTQIERVFNQFIKFNGSQSKLKLNKYELDMDYIEPQNTTE